MLPSATEGDRRQSSGAEWVRKGTWKWVTVSARRDSRRYGPKTGHISTGECVYKPSSVCAVRQRTVIIQLGRLLPDASCTRPGSSAGRLIAPLFGLAPSGVWPADMSPCRRWALTPPFHPYPLPAQPHGRARSRRYRFCATFRRIAPPGCYPALCPVELGLSSDRRRNAGTRSPDTLSAPSLYPKFAPDSRPFERTFASCRPLQPAACRGSSAPPGAPLSRPPTDRGLIVPLREVSRPGRRSDMPSVDRITRCIE